jgi:hypothetical protein
MKLEDIKGKKVREMVEGEEKRCCERGREIGCAEDDIHGGPPTPLPLPLCSLFLSLTSVSPERCDVITPHPASLLMRTASIDSLMVPIWLTLRRRALEEPASMARLTRLGLVTRWSSPTI